MWIVSLPVSCPCLFWAVAILWSGFQAYAGFHYGLYICDNAERKSDSPEPSRCTRLLAYGVHHGIFYFTSSLSGFVAWRLAHWVTSGIGNWADIAGGTGAVLVALTVLSILGVSGALSRILYLGKWPR